VRSRYIRQKSVESTLLLYSVDMSKMAKNEVRSHTRRTNTAKCLIPVFNTKSLVNQIFSKSLPLLSLILQRGTDQSS